jgi:hypothetical protein
MKERERNKIYVKKFLFNIYQLKIVVQEKRERKLLAPFFNCCCIQLAWQ